MSLKKNVIANYVGQGWRALMSLAFIPVYINYLGIEAYGLIGVFSVLQAWLGLVDMGMKPALSREMARFRGGAHNTQTIRDLLRSIEVIAIAVAAAVALGIWATSGWLATDWLTAKNLPAHVVTRAFAVMGAVTALSFIESIYVSSMIGLQRQVLQNVVSSIMSTMRGLGAVVVLVWISPTIEAFFVWQGAISLISAAVFAAVVYGALPSSPRSARFSGPALAHIWRFATGMTTLTLLSLLLTQVDKILLSRLLHLDAFGYYVLAGMVANALYMLGGPIASAFYPRLTELLTRGDELALRETYHQGAQFVAVLMGAAAVMLMMFGDRVLLLWTADAALTHQVAPLMVVLALGTLLHGLMWMPYHLQLAYGWTALAISINTVAVGVLIPSILWALPKYGAIGAAWAWVALNTSYLLISINFMHRRLLTTDKWRWYRQDVFIPLIAATATAWLCLLIMPSGLGRLSELGVLCTISGLVLVAAALAAPIVRHQITQHVPPRIKEIAAKTLSYSR